MGDITDSAASSANNPRDAVLRYCLCWRLRRGDGVTLGLTDHDTPLLYQGDVYRPGATLEAGRFTQGLDLRPGRAAAAGVLASEGITETELRAGLWDRCQVDVYRVNWSTPDDEGFALWHGYLSEITLTASGAFEAELVSRKSDLERTIGRVYARRCDAQLGDARCGIASQGRSCDKRFETCRDVFANTTNFRGFPHMPGNDFILSGPAASNNDGGKR